MAALAVFGGIVGIAILIVVSSIFNGYALSVLWGWFIVPTFGLPQLSIASAIGIALVIGYLTHQTHNCKKEELGFGENVARSTVSAIVRPSLVLFFGWVVHLFM